MLDGTYKIISIVLFSLLLSLGIYTFFLHGEVESLRTDNETLNANAEKYDQAIKQAEENQKVKVEYVDREVKVIEVQTKTKLVPVKEYIYDHNKTDCQNSISILRSSGF